MSRPPVRTGEGLLRAHDRRIALLERRLSSGGSGGGGGGGPIIDVPPALPDPVRWASGGTHTPSATSWAPLPGATPQSITVSRACWVLVTLGAWMLSTAGEVRTGVSLSGATVLTPPNTMQVGMVGSGAWGQTMYAHNADTQTASGQRTLQRVLLLNPGTTTFQIEAYIATAGSKGVNYPVLEVVPLYYDDTPVPVQVTLAGLTRRQRATSVTLALTDTAVDFDTAELQSGHWSYSATTKTFTCLVPGQYSIRYSQGFGTIGAGNNDYVLLTLVKNGAAWVEGLGRRDSLGGNTAVAQGASTFQVGDTISAAVRAGQAGGSAAVNAFRSWIELIPVVQMDESPVTDSGWVDFDPALLSNGFTLGAGRFQGRKSGTTTEIRGSLTAPAVGAGSGSIDFSLAIPAAYRPTTQIELGVGYTTATIATAIVRPDGTMAVGRQVAFSGTFLFKVIFLNG